MGAARTAAHAITSRAARSGSPRPSVRRAADRRAHLLEQEVTLAYLRELAATDAAPPR